MWCSILILAGRLAGAQASQDTAEIYARVLETVRQREPGAAVALSPLRLAPCAPFCAEGHNESGKLPSAWTDPLVRAGLVQTICRKEGPDANLGCRIEKGEVSLTLGAPMIRGDSAFVDVLLDRPTDMKQPDLQGLQFILVRAPSSWTVSRVRVAWGT